MDGAERCSSSRMGTAAWVRIPLVSLGVKEAVDEPS